MRKAVYFAITGKVRILIFLVLVYFLPGCQPTTTIYMVRHGERPAGLNPPLNAAGLIRARTLADSLANRKINSILTTDSNRTRQTAQPTAARFNLPFTIYGKDTIPALVAKLKTDWGSGC